MALFKFIDAIWLKLASVKLTIVLLVGLAALSIPGTVIMQYNISNIDPALQYDYDFWSFGIMTQLFTAYHSIWYVALLVLLSMNLIACSVERWPQMWQLANARPVKWGPDRFRLQNPEWVHEWSTSLDGESAKAKFLETLKQRWLKPVIVEEVEGRFQIFWQTGRWSRIANYLVHISLLVVFAGGIVGAMYGFEGGANIPAGSAVDTFLLFKEGKGANLVPAPGGLSNERMLGFRLEAESFKVSFYKDFPGRAKEYLTRLNVIENGRVVKSQQIAVNSPMTYGPFTFYQSSYGPMGDFQIQARIVEKKNPMQKQFYLKTKLGEAKDLPTTLGLASTQLVALRALNDVQNLGPGVQFQEFKNGAPQGKAFWVLKDYPEFDFRRAQSSYGIVIDELEELYFSGLQIGYDPGAPIYWLGCFGMLLGTFYALFVQHQKFYVQFERGKITFSGSTHRLKLGFDKKLARLALLLKRVTIEDTMKKLT